MRYSFLVPFLFFALLANSQSRFLKGYVILNSGEKIDCRIKDLGWRNNPKSIKCKVEGEDKIFEIREIQEFGVPKTFKYVRFTGLIDQSIDLVNRLTENKEPEWAEETVFLEVLVGGEHELYRYKKEGTLRFFHKPLNGQIEQLIYKRFVFNPSFEDNPGVSALKLRQDKILNNNTYKSQLIKNYSSSLRKDFNLKVQKLTYKTKPLVKFFLYINKF